jgi:hypothetical protein
MSRRRFRDECDPRFALFVEAINDKGQIGVNGIVNETGTQAAFLLTPVP